MEMIILALLAVILLLLILILIRMPRKDRKSKAQEPSAMLLMQQNISALRGEVVREMNEAGERSTRNH